MQRGCILSLPSAFCVRTPPPLHKPVCHRRHLARSHRGCQSSQRCADVADVLLSTGDDDNDDDDMTMSMMVMVMVMVTMVVVTMMAMMTMTMIMMMTTTNTSSDKRCDGYTRLWSMSPTSG